MLLRCSRAPKHVASSRGTVRGAKNSAYRRVSRPIAAVAALSLAIAGLLVPAAGPGTGTGIQPAAAAANLLCTADAIYSLGDSGYLYGVAGTTGAATKVGTGTTGFPSDANGLGVVAGGTAAYAVQQANASAVNIYKYTASTATFATVGAVTLGSNLGGFGGIYIVGGAVDPANGIYYFGGYDSSGGFVLYGWNTNTDTTIGLMAKVSITGASQANGDLAFDSAGNMYLVNSEPGVQILASVPSGQVPQTASTSRILTAGVVATATTNNAYNGVTFDGTGKLFLQTSGTPSTIYYGNGFTSLGSNSLRQGTTNVYAVDLASCSLPGSLTLKKNVGARVSSADQFTLQLKRGTTVLSSATTTGTATGVQPVAAGPSVGNIGIQYSIAEVASGTTDLTKYDSTYQCLYEDGTTVFASGTGTSATLPAFPDSTTGNNNITCTFTNTPKPTLTLVKQVANTGGGTSAPTAWTLKAQNGTASPLINAQPSQNVTTTSAATQTAVAAAGVPYALSESGPSGYSASSWVCTQGGSVANGVVTLTAGANVTCTVTNTWIPAATLTIKKTIQDVNGLNPAAGQGWTVGAAIGTGSSAGTTISLPAAQVTGSNGSAPNPWSIGFPAATATANLAVSETQQAGWQFVSGTCVVTHLIGAPSTVTLSGASSTVSGVQPGDAIACEFVNKQLAGSVTWHKVADDSTKTPLGGSEWTLTGPGVPSNTVVTDCVQSPCLAGAFKDQDPAVGGLRLAGLAWGSYTLTESKAPAGYVLDSTVRQFSITSTALDYGFANAFVNSQQPPLVIPLTGGMGADLFSGFGGALVLLGIAVWGWNRWSRGRLGLRRGREREV